MNVLGVLLVVAIAATFLAGAVAYERERRVVGWILIVVAVGEIVLLDQIWSFGLRVWRLIFLVGGGVVVLAAVGVQHLIARRPPQASGQTATALGERSRPDEHGGSQHDRQGG